MAVESSAPVAQPRPSAFKRIPVVVLFVVGILVFGFLAPSIMGLALLALLVVVPLAVVAGLGWFLWNSVRSMRKPNLAAEPELEPEQQIA